VSWVAIKVIEVAVQTFYSSVEFTYNPWPTGRHTKYPCSGQECNHITI
jgi:hypothetical protein